MVSKSCAFVLLVLGMMASTTYGADAVCPHKQSGLKKWSLASTWSPSSIPTANAAVVLPANSKVLLDMTPPLLASLNIPASSELIFDDPATATTIALNVTNFDVFGKLTIGSSSSSSCWYKSKAIITLVGEKPANASLGLGTKYLAAHNGSLIEMHGSLTGPTWVRLAKVAYAGNSSITVHVTPTGWKVGDTVVIASTDYDPAQSEERVITAISQKVITLNAPLTYMHYGLIDQGVDERGEVGLLTRNIVIRGDNSATSNAVFYGGHTIFLPNSTAHVQKVEFTGLGQRGILARYPVHFHMNRNYSKGSYVNFNSIHHNFHRCLTFHYSNHIVARQNVAYDTYGHCYFFENAAEINNTLDGNLGIYVRQILTTEPIAPAVIPTDNEPSIFWITRPDNHWINNVAVGGKFAYWFTFPEHPFGNASSAYNDLTDWIRYTPLGTFDNNYAHSCGSGLFVDETPDGLGAAFIYQPRIYSYNASNMPSASYNQIIELATSQPAPAVFRNFTAYKTTNFGVWIRSDATVLDGARLADNLVGVNNPRSNVVINCRFVGDTGNVGNPTKPKEDGRSRPYLPNVAIRIVGFQNYDSGETDVLFNNTFINFKDYAFSYNTSLIRPASALGGIDGQDVIAPINRYFGNVMSGTNNPVYWMPPQARYDSMRGAAIIDADGSVTGQCGATVVANSSHLYDPAICTFKSTWNAWLCPPNSLVTRKFGFSDTLDVAYNSASVYPYATFYRLPTGGSVRVHPYAEDSSTIKISYSTNVVVNTEMAVAWEKPLPYVTVTVQYFRATDWLRVAFPYPAGTTFTVSNSPSYASPLTQVTTKAALTRETWFYDTTTNYLWIEIGVKGDTLQYVYGLKDQMYVFPEATINYYIKAICPSNNCSSPSSSASSLIGQPISHAPSLTDSCETRLPKTYTYKNFRQDIFVDSLNPAWAVPAGFSLSNTVVHQGNASMLWTIKGKEGKIVRLSASSVNLTQIRETGGEPYLEFAIRSTPAQTVLNPGGQYTQRHDVTLVGLRCYDAAGSKLTFSDNPVPVYSRTYADPTPIASDRWTLVRFKIQDALTFNPSATLVSRLELYNFNVWATQFYIDSISVVSYQVSY